MSTSFGTAASTYEASRPQYPMEAVEWMLAPVAGRERVLRVADVGAGTGKLTRSFLRMPAEVIAVDPDPAMLRTLNGSLGDVPTVVGTAEALPLRTSSVDAIVAGQTWHWVSPVAGSHECGRVIRPGGILGLVWNIRDESTDWVRRLTEIMHGSAAEQMLADGDPAVAEPFGALERAEWRWTRTMTREDLTAMARSRSYFITASPKQRARIEAGIAALLDDLEVQGQATIDLPYVTRAHRATR